ncbi:MULTISPECIES: helix-turn-helix transcriptional regulator [Actinomadura]|uniref:Helix-turn-helix transcriptional regulator n=1 Tax=Actinomadura miaoliensis TaxID=430685 RepID=A0ABP7WKY6_9ACTN
MDKRAELTEFLRSRRARLQPEDVGLPPFGGRRRVPGLRREELAQLAGVSVDYYVRLEQGRTRNVSEEVLDAVAGALRLDDDERAYLRNLARPARSARRRPPARAERVRPGVRRLLEMAEGVPAYVFGRRCDVLAWNRLACALFTDFGALPPAERNWARLIFLNEEMQALFEDWTVKAKDTVAFLRLSAGEYPDDPELAALVGELSVRSEDFRRWWADHNVKDKSNGRKVVLHPLVGRIELDYETLRLPDNRDQMLTTYTVEAGSPSETALRLLGSLGVSSPVPDGVSQRD